jgi:methyl-accepting chemotaxis protein
MKIKMRLTVIVSVIMVLVTGSVAALLLILANRALTNAAKENMKNLTGVESKTIQAGLDVYFDRISTLAYIMNGFEEVDIDKRRVRFDENMESLIWSIPEMAGIASVWRNQSDGTSILDGDAQYDTWFHRRNSAMPQKDLYRNSGENWQNILSSLTKDSQVSNVLKGRIEGKEMYYANIIVPIIPDSGRYNGQMVGFVIASVNLSFISERIAEIHPYGTGRAVLYAHDGTIAGHYNQNMVGKPITDPESVQTLGEQAVKITQSTLESGEGAFGSYHGRFFYGYPFFVGTSKTAWTMLSSVEASTVLKDVTTMLHLAIIIAVVAIIIAMVVIWFASGSIARRIVNVGKAMKDISEGEGDLTRRLKIYAQDEIGAMGTYFNNTIEKIHKLVLSIKHETITLSDIGSELSTNMTETAASINQITANIQSLKSQVQHQSSSVTETNATMQRIVENIDNLGNLVEKQTASVSQSSSSVEQMIANIQSVTQTLIKNADDVRTLAEASEVGRNGLQDVASDIQEIAHESEGLLEINAVMQNIASQTNLLSMNAAIEAAHAGEAGKGFAVVADEIRKLAENSSEQSKTISTVLKKIKDSIDKITRSTNAVLNKFEAIDNGVKTVSDQEHNIRDAMEEQNSGSQQILEAMNRLNEVTAQVKDSTTEMLKGSQQVILESRNLENVTQKLESGMSEMASGAEQMNVATNRVNTISDDNKQHIDNLVSEVSKFIVE